MQPARGHGQVRQERGDGEGPGEALVDDAQADAGDEVEQRPPPELGPGGFAFEVGVLGEAGLDGFGEGHLGSLVVARALSGRSGAHALMRLRRWNRPAAPRMANRPTDGSGTCET